MRIEVVFLMEPCRILIIFVLCKNMEIMKKLVLVRHGESEWNKLNRFTGWTDVNLSEKGIEEAKEAGRVLKKEGYEFDVAYTSVLKRAIKTLWLILEEMDMMWLPEVKSWRLNEKHYGKLQGLNKAETAKKYGEEQVLLWRRGFDVLPPLMDESYRDEMLRKPPFNGLNRDDIPLGESLKNTIDRVLPLWHSEIEPAIKEGKRIIIAAHGNSLRAIVKYLDNISDEAILKVNIPTGIPLVYELDDETLKPIKSYYIGDPEKIKKAQEAVANQGKAK